MRSRSIRPVTGILLFAAVLAGLFLCGRRDEGELSGFEEAASGPGKPDEGPESADRASGTPGSRPGVARSAVKARRPSARPNLGGIEGFVVDGDTASPVIKFLVRIERSESEEVGSFTRGGFARRTLSPSRIARYVRHWLRGDDSTRSFRSPEGKFAIVDLRAGVYQFRFEAEGYLPRSLDPFSLVVFAGKVRTGVRVKLRRPAGVTGSVVEEGSGAPIAGATVRANPEAGSRLFVFESVSEIETGRAGDFDFENLEPGTVRLEASSPEFVEGRSEPVELRPGGRVEGVRIALRRGGEIEGFVLVRDGGPVPSASVSAWRMDGTMSGQRTATTGAKGSFRIVGLAAGAHRVEARLPDSPQEAGTDSPARRARASVVVEEGRTVRVELVPPVSEGCTVRGRVPRGSEPLPLSWVALIPARSLGAGGTTHVGHETERRSLQTRKDGSFAFEGVPPGEAWLRMSSNLLFRFVVPEAREFFYDPVLPSGGIDGRVVRASDGAPLAGVEVWAYETEGTGWPGSGPGETDKEGLYRIRDLPPGEYRVRARPGGHWPVGQGDPGRLGAEASALVRVGAGVEKVDFSLMPAGAAAVHVSDPTGRPVTDALVLLRRRGESPDPWLREWAKPLSDEPGLYLAEGLVPGDWSASVAAPGFALAFTDSGPVGAGEEVESEVGLREGTRVLVRCLEGGGLPFRPDWLDLADDRGNVYRPLHHLLFGKPEENAFPAILSPGAWTASVSTLGFRRKSVPIRVGEDSPQQVVVSLERDGEGR